MASDGSVYQRKSDDRWVGKYYVTDPMTGKRKPKYVYSSKPGRKGEQEARRKLYKAKEKAEAGDLSNSNTLTVAGWLRKYLEVYCDDLADTTKEGYEGYVENHIIPFMGSIKLRDLRSIHIQNFYNHERNVPIVKMQLKDGKMVPKLDKNGNTIPVMEKGKPKMGYAEKTILQEHRIMKRAFEKAKVDGFTKINPCDGVDAPSPEEKEPIIYTEEEFLLLLDKLEGNRIEAIVLIAGMCGLRRGELMGLTWEDIDFETGVINIERNRVPTKKKGPITKEPKSKKGTRKFIISPGVLIRLKQIRGIGTIYLKLDGTEYHPASVSRHFSEFLKDNGLKHTVLQDLRHFNATMMLKYGVSEKETMERLGHSSAEMTKRYQHILKEMDVSSAEKLDNVLNKNSK